MVSEEKVILITLKLRPDQLDELKNLAGEYRLRNFVPSEGQTIPSENWEPVEILYTLKDLPLPDQAPNLRWIQFHFAGIDAFMDAPVLHKKGVQATTLSGANAPQVAEHALSLMLALGHHLPEMLADQSRSQWSLDRLKRYVPSELIGSTVGIVGYGSVGQRLAGLLQSLDVTVLASKRDLLHISGEEFEAEGLGDPSGALVRRLYPGKALRSMLKACDFVVVTVPLTDETRGMLGAGQLAAMKPGSFLVDVSRGGVVDHDSLIAALDKGQLGGAGLDVFPEEPLPADSPLWEMQNVIISPHVAGLSQHYNERAFTLFKENLRRYLGGEALLNLVDLDRGY